ncbi:hypothetical protein ACT3SP_15325 [Brachybacterium sp. AOP43-C2-M15]|uniref:hypothetical protein n=1 Tax=Brachybacterium sp. AOP43-C2-M15 TaxID=3457661 RepID=UPI0040345109
MSTDRLRARDLRRLGYGLHARIDVDLTEAAILSALTRTDPRVVARGLSAARFWKLPLPRPEQNWVTEPEITPVEVSANGHARRDTAVVRWNRQRIRPEEIVVADDVRVTDRVRTWLDLAQLLPLDPLVHIGDHLIRHPRSSFEKRNSAFASPSELRDAMQGYPGPGRPLLRQALALIRVGSDSPAETALRLAAERAHLPRPVLNTRQFVDGYDLGEPDLAWPEWKVCVEHDGPSHRTSAQQQRDIARRELRESLGWVEVQTVAVDLRDGCFRGVRRMREALVRQGWRRGE